MTPTSHTLKPWTKRRSPHAQEWAYWIEGPSARNARPPFIAAIPAGGDSEANSDLVAAAPDLLAALEDLLSWAETRVDPSKLDTTREITLARATIAQAVRP